MNPEKLAFLKAINANPRERTIQLAFADWLSERDDPQERFWRVGRVGLGGLGGLVGRVGRGGRGGLVGRGGRGGLVGRVGRVGRGGLVGLVGLGGLVGRGGRGGLVGLGGQLLNPENPIVLIPGEQALVFIPNGYGFSVLVGKVQTELAHGWIVDPCREIIATNNDDCWVELAAGKKEKLRSDAQYGPLIEGGMRVPLGCLSMVWQGELP